MKFLCLICAGALMERTSEADAEKHYENIVSITAEMHPDTDA